MLSFVFALLAVLGVVSGFVSNVNTRVGGNMNALSMSTNTEFSKSVPFLKKPKNLDGLIVSDVFSF